MYSNTAKASVLALLAALAVPANAYWRMGCTGTLLEGRLDPIVAPGKVSGHTHVILGGNGFAPNMNYADTQASTCTSCSIQGDFSNYWVPKLYYAAQNGSFTSVPVSGGTVYYQQRVTSPTPDKYPSLKAYPEGFRMTAGNPELRTFDPSSLAQQAVSHVCLGGNVPQAAPLPNGKCPDGLRSQIYFPSCWDGVNLDSPNHQDHMSYPVGQHFDSGVCPTSHPVPMISIFYEFIFSTISFEWYGSGQPFVYSMGDPTGYGFHGDFLNGWDIPTLQNGIDKFTTSDPGCSDNVYCGNIFTAPAVDGNLCTLPQIVDEQINGNMPALPGCNPVTMNPAPVPNCAATTTLGVVDSFIFTDMTSKGWEYLGCGVDVYGNPALGNPVQDSPTMTVENCIALCASKGSSIAGLEYSSQCMCGNTLPARASPTPGMVGDCDMACAGNSSEFCGAGSRLSLYQKCTGTCKNAQFGLAAEGVNVPVPTAASQGPAGQAMSVSTQATPTSPAAPVASNSSKGVVAVVTSPSVAKPIPPIATATTTAAAAASPTPSAPAEPGNVTLPAGWTSAGCYTDNLNPRSMTGITFAWWGQPVTSSGCAAYCAAKGFSMAGTEYTSQCFCSNSLYHSSPAPSSACNMPCSGDASQTCGGPGHLSVFKAATAPRRSRSAHLRRHGIRADAAS